MHVNGNGKILHQVPRIAVLLGDEALVLGEAGESASFMDKLRDLPGYHFPVAVKWCGPG